MQAGIRRKLSMATRAADFAVAHPSTDASYTALVARLQQKITQANALALQQNDGHAAENAAIDRRDSLRLSIQRVQLRHLLRVAQVAAEAHPELQGLLAYPPPGAPNRDLINMAKGMLAAVAPYKDALTDAGLGDTALDELTAAVTQFDQATDDAHAGRRDHVGARAELDVLGRDCVKLVKLLDGIYRMRFSGDAESLAAWESSRKMSLYRSRSGGDPAPSPDPAPAPAPVPVTDPPPVAEDSARAA